MRKPNEFEYRQHVAEVEKADGSRDVKFILSTAGVDRMGDVIDQSGWDLRNYKANPVVAYAHQTAAPPIGRSKFIGVEDGVLKGVPEFASDVYPLAKTIEDMVQGGWLRTASVGFRPIGGEGVGWKFADDPERKKNWGIDFLKSELLEWSIVPIPANPQALLEAKAAGVDTLPVLEWAECVIKSAAPLKPEAEAVIKLVDPPKAEYFFSSALGRLIQSR